MVEEARKEKTQVAIVQKVTDEPDEPNEHWKITTKNSDIIDCLREGFQIVAGTSFMWARQELFEAVDFLFVDEAGQLSLIDTVALSHAAK
ncbi:MAG: hypothetical protein E6H10_18565, partial [Bacteroidetes bacterium]